MPLPERFRAALEQVPPPSAGDAAAVFARGRRRARWRHVRNGLSGAVVVAAVAVAGVSLPGGDDPATPHIAPVPDAAGCPVTVAADTNLVPPAPYPPEPAIDDAAWYGTPQLWTVVHKEPSGPRKSVWWSIDFDVTTEPRPDLRVVYERLDADTDPVVLEGSATNAHTGRDGWFMIAGLEPAEPGCWRATATYGDTELTVVREIAPWERSDRLPLPDPGGVAAEHLAGHPVFVVHDEDGRVRVLDAENPHVTDGPPPVRTVLAWCATSGWFEDLWHGSSFTRDGSWAGGPAPTGMAPYEVLEVVDGEVVVGDRGDAPARDGPSDADPPAGPSCGDRTALYLPDHPTDPTVVADLVTHPAPGIPTGLWYPTPGRVLGESPRWPS